MNQDYKYRTQSFVHFIKQLSVIAFMFSACTTAAPTDEQGAVTPSADHKSTSDQSVVQSLQADYKLLQNSIFVSLSKDAKDLELWEKSEAWIKLYQGQVHEALPTFETEIKAQDTVNPAIIVGKLRSQLELAVSYQHLNTVNQFLIKDWLSYERSRPDSDLHKQWYQLIEILYLSQNQQNALDQQSLKKLTLEAKKSEELSEWLSFLLEGGSSPANIKIETQYRRWQSFTKLLKAKKIAKAGKKLSKLKARGFIFTASGQGKIPDLEVFDPRIPRVLQDYYASAILESCKSVPFGSYYCARAHEILNETDLAIAHYKKAQQELQQLLNQAPQNYIEHVLLTSHTSFSGFEVELRARLHALGEKSTDQSGSKTVKQEDSAKSELQKSTPDILWTAFSQDESQTLPQLFPERRRALGQIFSKALENGKGAQLNYLASLGLNDRWLDELHYLYAGMLIKRDQRVQALKVLNTTEEAKAGSRLQGRNRLPRLLLSSYNQLKMGRYRVSAKYFQRLKAKIPALSFVLVMTSDILSGKSFENNGSRANVGQ